MTEATPPTWIDAFQPVLEFGSVSGERPEVRAGQAAMGQAVLDAVGDRASVLVEAPCGVGKSLAYLVPALHALRRDPKHRTVISTETTALQDQLVDKDLPFLHEVYGGFTFRALKGRSWYLCKNRMLQQLRGNASLSGLVTLVNSRAEAALGAGEQRDVERVIGRELDREEWREICGESTFCGENSCRPGACWSSRARQLALDADVVVTNHAMLRTNADADNSAILGDFKTLVVDEAHTLERVLVDGWTYELRPWDREQLLKRVWKGLEKARSVADVASEVGHVEHAERDLERALGAVQRLFVGLEQQARSGAVVEPHSWGRMTRALAQVYLAGGQSAALVSDLTEYEVDGPTRFQRMADTFTRVAERLRLVGREMEGQGVRGVRNVKAGSTAARKLGELFALVAVALGTRDGIVMWDRVPYAILADGWQKRGLRGRPELDLRLRAVPLDVSGRARASLFSVPDSTVLVSATLKDPATGDFRYVTESLGLSGARTLAVESPFDFERQQMVYVTDGRYPAEDVSGARYSMQELEEVLHASSGRSLVLFTARGELEHAAAALRASAARGGFPHRILVQEDGISKQKLAEWFMRDTHSVLLATKSFFTGMNFTGEACSTVVLAKYPLPQYNALCRAQIAWWRGRGFPKFYEREGLLVFAQAVGRLIRAASDRGVVAILDQRAARPTESVARQVELGLDNLCPTSRVTRDVHDVSDFLSVHSPITAVT